MPLDEKKLLTLGVCLIFTGVLLVHFQVASFGALSYYSGPDIGIPAPIFSLESLHGNQFQVTEARSHGPVLLVFGDCHSDSIQKFSSQVERYLSNTSPQPLACMIIQFPPYAPGEKDPCYALMTPVLKDTNGSVFYRYNIKISATTLPTGVLINRSGVVYATYPGQLPELNQNFWRMVNQL